MFNPGKFKTKIEFFDREELEEVQNDVGEYVQKHKKIGTDWGELIPQTGSEFLQNRKTESEMTYRFKLRNRKDIEVGDYVKFNNIEAEIIYLAPFIDYISQTRFMEMVVKWRS